MNWDAIGAIGEIIGAAAVVATLAYLARQIRENTNAVQGAMELDVAQQLASWNGTRTPEERAAWSRAARGEALSETDANAFLFMCSAYLFLCEGWYRQFKRGLMAAEVWEEHADAAAGLLSNPYIGAWWDERVASLSSEFRSHIERRRAEHPGRWALRSPVPAATEASRQSS